MRRNILLSRFEKFCHRHLGKPDVLVFKPDIDLNLAVTALIND